MDSSKRSSARRAAARKSACAAVLCLALAAGACAGGPGTSNDTDHVTAVVLPFLTMAPFHIAAREGYFAEQNLEVDFVRLPRQQDLQTALVRGDVDVSAGMPSVTTFNMVAGGARIRFVAALGELDPAGCDFNAFVARRELVETGALRDPERLRGLRFDLNVTIPYGYWADLLLGPLGATIDDLDVIDLPEPAAVEALLAGTIDATIVSEPFLGLLNRSAQAAVWRPSKEVVPGFMVSLMSYGGRLLDERPDVGERFATAMMRAARQYREGKTPRNLELLEEFTGLSAEQVAAACWPSGPPDGRVDASTLVDFQRWAVQRGLMDRLLSEEEMVDHRFADAAATALAR